MNNPDDKLKEFCRKYDARVGPSSRRMQRARPMPLEQWLKEPDLLTHTVDYETIPVVDITLPEDRFRALLEHDEWISKAGLQDNSFFNNNVSRVAQMVVEMEKETRIRHENPAVKLAYEKYLMLLRTVYNYYE